MPRFRLADRDQVVDLDTSALRSLDAAQAVSAAVANQLAEMRHGDAGRWIESLLALSTVAPTAMSIADGVVTVGAPSEDPATVERALQGLHPWRKGPFRVRGVAIDAEWRSNLKWDRVAPHLDPVQGRRILDVGSGNGYSVLRLVALGAHAVLGIDPSLLTVLQFTAVRRLASRMSASVLPLTLETLPAACSHFDTVLSMGVLYHRRNPRSHLAALHDRLRPGGQLVLESLVQNDGTARDLTPAGRYLKMRNVWCIPTPERVLRWLEEVGFYDGCCVESTPTTTSEQRRTPFMTFESLAEFLDPNDPTRTIEGHPGPVRAVFVARRQ